MATFVEIQNRINNDYLNRGTFIEETKNAIKAAIRSYENRRWAFNETAVALATSAGVAYVAFPSNLIRLDQLQITVNSVDYDLIRRDRAWITAANATRSQAQPTDFATYLNRINLSAIPDDVYALPLHYIKRLQTLSADTDTNAWLEGTWQDVICYHAAKIVWGASIRNDKEAAKFQGMELDALSRVTEHIEQYASGQIKSTSF